MQAAKVWAREGIQAKSEGRESASGTGSYLKNAKPTIDLIHYTIKTYKISKIIDMGCGDWNWMQHVDLNNIQYMGYDASDEIIQNNIKLYKKPNINFKVADIIHTIPIKADVCICRDVLFHLKNEFVLKVLKNIQKSKTKFLITTCFLDVKTNKEIRHYGKAGHLGWGFREINLNVKPFNLQNKLLKYIEESAETTHGGFKRYICLYKM